MQGAITPLIRKSTTGRRGRGIPSEQDGSGARGPTERPGRLCHYRPGHHQHPAEPRVSAGGGGGGGGGGVRLQGVQAHLPLGDSHPAPPEELRHPGCPAPHPLQVLLHSLRGRSVRHCRGVSAALRELSPRGPCPRAVSGADPRDGGRRQPDHSPRRQGRRAEPARPQRQHILSASRAQEAQDVPLRARAQCGTVRSSPPIPSAARHNISHVELPIYIYFIL